MLRIALISGDCVGSDLLGEARRVLEAVVRAEHLDFELSEWEAHAAVAEDGLRTLADGYAAVLLGALAECGAPRGGPARDFVRLLRARLDLYVSFRPCVLLAPELCPLKRFKVPVRLEIFREDSEGARAGLGGSFKEGTPGEISFDAGVSTRVEVERIVRAAFAFARARRRPRLTLVDGGHLTPHAGGLWRRVFAEVGSEFPEVERDTAGVETLLLELVRGPERYAVIVAPDLFGGVVSDVAAELVGGLALAAGAEINPGRIAVFGPVRRPRSEIAGAGMTSPLGAVRCVALLLDHFGHTAAGERVERAVAAALAEGMTTPDLGGSFSTEAVGAWLAARVAGEAADENATRP